MDEKIIIFLLISNQTVHTIPVFVGDHHQGRISIRSTSDTRGRTTIKSELLSEGPLIGVFKRNL